MSEEENKSVEEEEKVAAVAATETAEPEKKKEVTAEDLLKSDLDGVKIRRAKGSKNITSGVVNVLATLTIQKSLSAMHVVMLFPGPAPANATSVAPANPPPTPLRSSLKTRAASPCHTA